MNALAQQLASLGRNGDEHLVHMTTPELQGLAALGQATGRPITTNPQTGLPEASLLGDLLPAIASAALMYFTGGGSAAAEAAAAGGAASAGGLGGTLSSLAQNPMMLGLIGGGARMLGGGNLMQGIQAGLLAGGTAGLMGGLESAGTNAMLPSEAADATYGQKLAAGASSAFNAPGDFLSQNKLPLTALGLGGLGIANDYARQTQADAIKRAMDQQAQASAPNFNASPYFTPHPATQPNPYFWLSR